MAALTNPLAFPISPEIWATHPDFHGMNLRDWFAGQALIGLLHPRWETDWPRAPKVAFEIADAMLAARTEGR